MAIFSLTSVQLYILLLPGCRFQRCSEFVLLFIIGSSVHLLYTVYVLYILWVIDRSG